MNKYIKDLANIIRNGDMENTYKMAWIRSIVEFCVTNPSSKTIHFDDLSPLIFGYYWNQTIFFYLEQGPNPKKRPKIHQIVKSKVDEYRKLNGYVPIFFTKVENDIDLNISQISNVLKENVCWRFQSKQNEVYDLDKENQTLKVHKPELLIDYADILFELINYRWVQKLENLNTHPRISQKVKGTDRENIKRANLNTFKEYLDIENPKRLSFKTGKPIPDDKLSMDHVIPWSYLYSDDLWNLVYVTRSENSSMNNRLPDEFDIEKLEKRNTSLLCKLDKIGKSNKQTEDLRLAIENNYVRKFWNSFRG
jgi:5-methylcytosine-specific restriction endonuclease McrA